jgi:hypothetical protein
MEPLKGFEPLACSLRMLGGGLLLLGLADSEWRIAIYCQNESLANLAARRPAEQNAPGLNYFLPKSKGRGPEADRQAPPRQPHG